MNSNPVGDNAPMQQGLRLTQPFFCFHIASTRKEEAKLNSSMY